MNPYRITILGAGVSGLACAHRLLELTGEKGLPLDLQILDAGEGPGGTLGTVEREGFLMEEGPDCFITEKPGALELAKKLGLEAELIRTNASLGRSFILRKGKLRSIPEGFYLLAPSRLGPLVTTPLLSPLGKLRAALEPLVKVRRDPEDESVGAFVRRRLGREVLENLAQPLIGGVFNADPDDLSLAACMPRFKEMELKYGSLLRGLAARRFTARSQVSGARYSLFVSFKRGMRTFADALASRIPGNSFHFHSPAESLRPTDHGTWEVGWGHQVSERDAVVAAVQPAALRKLLGGLDAEWEKLLARIPAHDSATLNLGFRRQDVGHPLDGFGFVVPAVEHKMVLGCTFASQKFEGRAPEGKVLLRAFLGKEAVGLLGSQGEAAVVDRVLGELQGILGLRSHPLLHHLAVYHSAMSYYRPGHLSQAARLEQKASESRGLYLAGNGLKGVGIPDCVAAGQRAAEKMFLDLSA